jgi:hypothetical protein
MGKQKEAMASWIAAAAAMPSSSALVQNIAVNLNPGVNVADTALGCDQSSGPSALCERVVSKLGELQRPEIIRQILSRKSYQTAESAEETPQRKSASCSNNEGTRCGLTRAEAMLSRLEDVVRTSRLNQSGHEADGDDGATATHSVTHSATHSVAHYQSLVEQEDLRRSIAEIGIHMSKSTTHDPLSKSITHDPLPGLGVGLLERLCKVATDDAYAHFSLALGLRHLLQREAEDTINNRTWQVLSPLLHQHSHATLSIRLTTRRGRLPQSV